MSKEKHIAEAQVDSFVAAVNSSRREPKRCKTIPELCRRSGVGHHGYCDWQIVPAKAGFWLAELASRLPYRWPLSFHALISGYQFPSFCCGPLEFYSVGLLQTANREVWLPVLRIQRLRAGGQRQDRPGAVRSDGGGENQVSGFSAEAPHIGSWLVG
jgi:hypothetical protein